MNKILTTKIYYSLIIALLLLTNFKSVVAQQNSLAFDGIDDFATTTGASSLIAGSNAISLSCWVYPNNPVIGFPDFDGFAGFRNNLDADFYLLQYSSTTVEARFTNSSGTMHDIIGTGLQLNTWQHITLTYDGGMLRYYSNGQLQDSVVASGNISNSAVNFDIGNLVYQGTNFYFQGKLDEVSLWNKALSAAEINSIYTCGIDSISANLQLYYKFNQGTAGGNNASITTLTDVSGHIDGALNNFAMTGSASNFVGGVNGVTSSVAANICPGDSFTFGSQVLTTSGVYTDTLTSVNGCDSIVTLTLTVSFVYATASDTICTGDSYTFGSQVLTTAGVYTDTLTSVSGCDSIITLTLAVSFVDTSVSLFSTVLHSNQSLATYQWVDCNNNYAIMPGDTSPNYVVTPPGGSYAVIVTLNGCVDTSSCHTVLSAGIEENNLSDYIHLYPNPVADYLSIDLDNQVNGANIQIADVEGRILWSTKNNSNNHLKIDASKWTSGIYIMKVTSTKGTATIKLQKK